MSDEDHAERLDRELIELLNELRVALPGVQVLFAFLLTLPFSVRFERLSGLQKDAYFGAFLATAGSSVLLMSPSAYHRLRWRQYDKERMLVTANRFAIAGLIMLALAVTGVVLIVTDLVFPRAAAGVTAGIAGVLAWAWFGLPLSRRVSDSSARAGNVRSRAGEARRARAP